MINCEAQRELLRNYQHSPPGAPPTPGAPSQVVELEPDPAPVAGSLLAGSPLVAPLPLAPPLKLLALDLSGAVSTAAIGSVGDEEEGEGLRKMGPVRLWTILLLLLIASAALVSGYLAICYGRHPYK